MLEFQVAVAPVKVSPVGALLEACRRHEERYDISPICDLPRLYMIPVVLLHPSATAELTYDV
jgi:hypothetical protein